MPNKNEPLYSGDWAELQENLQYQFKEMSWLHIALSHKSYANEKTRQNKTVYQNNERLEFLGDAVLDLAMSEILMALAKDASEGNLSKRRASLVNEESLSIIASNIGLQKYLLLGRGERASGGETKPRLLACTMEAVFGAIFKDSGYEETKRVVGRLYAKLLQEIQTKNDYESDFKTRLQEHCQQRFSCLPKYKITHQIGPSHASFFVSEIRVGDKWVSRGNGVSKKMAEQSAAKRALGALS